VRLKQQILTELSADRYPLVITEGHADAKKAKIFHNIYLAHGYKSLLSKGGALFIFGASLGPHDSHIVHAIKSNLKVTDVYLGIFGDHTSDANVATIASVQELLGGGRRAKRLHIFDSQTARVWR
jgi:hypothetical protein